MVELTLTLTKSSRQILFASMAFNSTLLSPPSLELIEEMTRDAEVVQQNVLAHILSQNADTEYLRGFGGVTDNETFRSKLPMVTYEDIRPLIRRMADGDRSPILCAQPISEFIMSSGTTAEPKLIPSTKEMLDRNSHLCGLLKPVINLHVKGLGEGMRLSFLFTRSDKETRGGIAVRTGTASLYKSDAFRRRLRDGYTSPPETIYCDDLFQSKYTQMLCGLYSREKVNRIETVFAAGLVHVIKFLEHDWKQLTQDIRTGSLNPKVTDPSIRERMAQVMRPDPHLANCISHECGKDNWKGIITRIWPNAKYLCTIVTGTMSQYISTLDFYSGGLPIVSAIYASSECYFGINLNPMCKPSQVSYTFMPNMAYFEFLPFEPNSQDPTTSELVSLVNVEIGREYEILVTTTAGLYRYRVGDIVQVTGFYNSAPQFQFVGRKNVVLNIDWEKTMETELQAAVDNASQLLRLQFNTNVVDYTSCADTTTTLAHYVIYLELVAKDLANWPGDEVLEQCCLVMEESLNTVYRMLRASDKSIGPLEIRIVKNGTFGEVMENAISRGTVSMSQYKVARCVRSKTMRDLLESRVESKHFSPSLPRLSPEEVSGKNIIQE